MIVVANVCFADAKLLQKFRLFFKQVDIFLCNLLRRKAFGHYAVEHFARSDRGVHSPVDALHKVVDVVASGEVSAFEVVDDVALSAAVESHRRAAACQSLDDGSRQRFEARC